VTDKRKQETRDIQRRTGWKYQFCQRLVRALGYTYVSDAVDAAEHDPSWPYEIGQKLNREAAEKTKESA
jgi:hypothetical protein